MSVPSIMMLPRSGLSSPISALRNTDLPVPDGPSITEISPAGIVRETSPQISCLPKDLVKPSTSISTPTTPLPCPHTDRAHANPRARVGLGSAQPYQRVNRGEVTSPTVTSDTRVTPCAPGCDDRPRDNDDGGPPRGGGPPCARIRSAGTSLDGDARPGALEGLAGLVGGLLVDLLQDGLGGGLDELLGLLEAEARERAHLLDDVDLLLAGGLEDDVELVLLDGLLGGSAATGCRAGRDGDRGGGGDAEGVLELLHELAQLEEGHLLERVEQLVGVELRHGGGPFGSVPTRPVAGPQRVVVVRPRWA